MTTPDEIQDRYTALTNELDRWLGEQGFDDADLRPTSDDRDFNLDTDDDYILSASELCTKLEADEDRWGEVAWLKAFIKRWDAVEEDERAMNQTTLPATSIYIVIGHIEDQLGEEPLHLFVRARSAFEASDRFETRVIDENRDQWVEEHDRLLEVHIDKVVNVTEGIKELEAA